MLVRLDLPHVRGPPPFFARRLLVLRLSAGFERQRIDDEG